MSGTSKAEASPPSISYAGASPAKTSAPLAKVLACRVIAAAYGTNSPDWWISSLHLFVWSKTLQAVRAAGLTRSETTWDGPAMTRYRSRLQAMMLERRTVAPESSLSLPTPQRLQVWNVQQWGPERRAWPVSPEGQTEPLDYGADRRLAGWTENPWATVPEVRSVANGLSAGVDDAQLKALGNAVIPQMAEVAGYVVRMWAGF